MGGPPKGKGIGSGRLPQLENLTAKSPSEILATLERLNLAPDVRALERAAKRAYEARLEGVIEGGGTPDAETWKSIDKDIARSMTGVLRQQTKLAIHQYRKVKLQTLARHFVWVAVGTGSCPSCEVRHGQRNTMKAWDVLGGPGSAVLICKTECCCSLQPDFIDD